MMWRLSFAPSALLLLTSGVAGGLLFKDVIPRSYKKERVLDIHVGHLISSQSTHSYEFYFLNYCQSTGVHHFNEDLAMSDDTPDYIEGVTMYD
jgi:hypothetical protein